MINYTKLFYINILMEVLMNYILSVLLLALSVSSMHAQEVINVYGSGGPHVALIEAAELFQRTDRYYG